LLNIIYSIKNASKTRPFRSIQTIISFYALLIIVSFAIHFIGLRTVEPLSYITVYRGYASWGLQMLKWISEIYLFFPLLLFLGIHLFATSQEADKSMPKYQKLLYFLPLFLVPSLILGIYQALFDINFLNTPYFAELNRVSGIGMDSNGLGLSIFLIFPLSTMAIIIHRTLWKRLFFILFALILLCCLFLSGTRTGLLGVLLFLLSLPFILIWSNHEFLKKGHLLITSGLMVLMVVSAFFLIRGNHPSSVALLKRLKNDYHVFKTEGISSILEESGRLELGLQAYRLTRMSPLAGWGPGGFYRNLHNIRFRNGKMNYFRFDNANNHYLQMTSELGIIGGVLNLFLHILPLWAVFRIRKRIHDSEERLIIGILSVTVCIMMLLFLTGPHTMAISVQWILVIMLCYLYVVAVRYGYTFVSINIKFIGVLLVGAILFTWGTYNNAFGKEGYRARQHAGWWLYKYEKNCYAYERWPEGSVRWCKGDASLQIPIKKGRSFPEEVTIALCVRNPDIKRKPVVVKYGGKSGPENSIVMRDYSWRIIRIPVTKDHMFEYMGPDGELRRYFVLSLDVSRTWIPKEWGVNEDTRELGVAVRLPFLLR
jgi:O-antigen ligase